MLLISAVSSYALLFFPYYPIFVLAILVLGVALVSVKYPTVGLAIGLLLSVLPAYYQNTAFGVIYGLLCLLVIGLSQTWPGLFLVTLSWALALSPLSILAFLPVLLAGLFFGAKGGAKVGLLSSFSLFFLGWVTGTTVLGLIVVPYVPAIGPNQGIPNPWVPASFVVGSRSPNPGAYTELQATLLRNFVYDMTFYIETACWTLAGYIAGFVAGKWKQGYPWSVAAGVAFVPLAAAYTYGSTFYGQNPGYMMAAGLVAALAAGSVLQLGKSDIARIVALQKARAAETKSIAQPILEKQEAKPEFAWDQIGGYQKLKQEIYDSVIMPLQKTEVARAYGAEPPRGILLFGPPGCGKTLLMKALAQTLKASFYYVKTSDIVSKWYGESEKRVTEVFNLARSTTPSILFFDEIDSIAKKRDLYGSDDTTPRLLSLMLTEMDGLEKEKATLLVIGATNKPELLDSAILRPGRFDRVLYVGPPDRNARKAIFEVHCREKPVADDVEYDKLASMTERFSGADIRNVVQMTAVELAKNAMKGKEILPIRMADITHTIHEYKPSITLQMLEQYERLRLDFERRVSRTEPELRPTVTFADIGGLDNVKQILMESIELPIRHPELMKKYGLQGSKGVLLFGPPGCGKTMIAKAAAGSLEAAFIEISGAGLSQKSPGDAASTIKETFYRARENPPSIIFIDEIESLASSREAGTQTLKPISELLIEMDGIKELRNVMVLAATNKPQWIDPALLRPGRFDKIVYIPPPDRKARETILRIHLREVPTSEIDYETLTKLTDGYSGADIAAVVREAKMAAVRDTVKHVKHEEITTQDLLGAIRRMNPSITRDSIDECEKFLNTYGERT